MAANDGNLGGVRSLLKHGDDLSAELSISWFEGGNSINHGNALQVACFKSAHHDGPVNKIIDALLGHFPAKSALDFGWDNEQCRAPFMGLHSIIIPVRSLYFYRIVPASIHLTI